MSVKGVGKNGAAWDVWVGGRIPGSKECILVILEMALLRINNGESKSLIGGPDSPPPRPSHWIHHCIGLFLLYVQGLYRHGTFPRNFHGPSQWQNSPLTEHYVPGVILNKRAKSPSHSLLDLKTELPYTTRLASGTLLQ